MRQLARYIAAIDEDEDGYVASLEKNMKKLGRGQICQETRKHAHVRILKMTFVHDDKFDSLYKGTIDAKRFGNLTSDKNGGIETKGYWCRGDFNTHLDGHDLHHFEDEQAVQMLEEKTIEMSSSQRIRH